MHDDIFTKTQKGKHVLVTSAKHSAFGEHPGEVDQASAYVISQEQGVSG